MRLARKWLVVSLASAGLAFACASKQPPPPAIETQEAELSRPSAPEDPGTEPKAAAVVPAKSDAGQKPVAPSSSATQVTLLEPGAEPRREIRHTFVNGAKQKLKMSANTTVSGVNVAMPAISMTGPIDTQITELKAGNARFKLTGGPFKTGTSGGGELAGAMGSLLGRGAPQKIAGWGILDPRGFVTEFHLTEGGGMGESAPVETGDPFPAEPVGVGARWEVKTTLQEKEGPVQQVSTYTLLKADKKLVRTQVARVQTPLNPDSEGGAAESSGEITFQLGGIYPTGKLNMTRKMGLPLALDQGGTLQLSSEVTISKR